MKNSEFRVLAKYLLMLAAIATVCVFFFSFLVRQAEKEWSLRRTEGFLSHLKNEIPKQENGRILFLGESDTLFAFRGFDIEQGLSKRGVQKDILNFGLLNATTTTIDLLARHIEELQANKQPAFETVFISFFPIVIRNSKKTAEARQSYQNISYCAAISTKKMLLNDWLSHPNAQLLDCSLYHVFYDNIPPSQLRESIANKIYSQPMSAIKRKLGFVETVWNPRYIGWDYSSRGHYFVDYPYVDESIRRDYQNNLKKIENDLEKQFKKMESKWKFLTISKDELEKFKINVRALKKISDKVVVYLPPTPAEELIEIKTRKKIDEALAEINLETGADILEIGKQVRFEYRDFFDVFHLNRSGQDKVTVYMTDYLLK